MAKLAQYAAERLQQPESPLVLDAMGSQITGKVECGSNRGDTVAAWQSDSHEMDETWREKATDKRSIHPTTQRINSPSRPRKIVVSFILPVQIRERDRINMYEGLSHSAISQSHCMTEGGNGRCGGSHP